MFFEDAIDDWCDNITELEEEKRGPALRNRLEGEAAVYKRVLDRDALRDPQDGVSYFKRTLRRHYIKGSQNVFLYRFIQFMKYSRGTQDLQTWITKFQITGTRLIESWMDLHQDLELTDQAVVDHLTASRLAHEQREEQNLLAAQAVVGGPQYQMIPWSAEIAAQYFVQFNEARKTVHRNSFPLTGDMLALIFVTLADLPQDQRNTLTSIMTHRNRQLSEYRITELRDLFMEMFCTTRTAVDNPLMQPSNAAQRRSFLVAEEGELEGTDGYWAEDEEDGAEGFLEANGDVFWIYDDENYSWFQRRFQGRRTRKGKGRSRKGKGKGRGGRRFFRPRKGKGKGKRRKGKSHMVGEEEYEDQDWNYEDETWNDGYWAEQDLYYLDEYAYFQRKGKGKRKKGKGKGKDEEGKVKPGDGKGKSNYVQPQNNSTSSALPNSQQAHYTSAASSSAGACVFMMSHKEEKPEEPQGEPQQEPQPEERQVEQHRDPFADMNANQWADWRRAEDSFWFGPYPDEDVHEYTQEECDEHWRRSNAVEIAEPSLTEARPSVDPPLEAAQSTRSDPARVDQVVAAESKQRTRTRRGGQNRRDQRAQQNKDRNPDDPAYLSYYLTLGNSDQLEIPVSTGSSEKLEVPVSGTESFAFHSAQTDQACENGVSFRMDWKMLFHQQYAFLIWDAPEPWAHAELWKHFASTLTQIVFVVRVSRNKFEILLCKFPAIQVY